jgi:hypothetical protein
MENCNRREGLEQLRNTILENLRNVRPVGAAMHVRPPGVWGVVCVCVCVMAVILVVCVGTNMHFKATNFVFT